MSVVTSAQNSVKNKAADLGGKAHDAAQSGLHEVRRQGSGVVGALHTAGTPTEWAYSAASGLMRPSLASWFISRNKTGDDKAQYGRWGTFIGHWAPTFVALGVALKLEEN